MLVQSQRTRRDASKLQEKVHIIPPRPPLQYGEQTYLRRDAWPCTIGDEYGGRCVASEGGVEGDVAESGRRCWAGSAEFMTLLAVVHRVLRERQAAHGCARQQGGHCRRQRGPRRFALREDAALRTSAVSETARTTIPSVGDNCLFRRFVSE